MAMWRLFAGALVFVCLLASGAPARAASQQVVIAQLQTAGSGSGMASLEFVELYNNSENDVDVTNWCVKYSSASDQTMTSLGCFTPPNTQTKLFIESRGSVTFASTAYEATAGKVWDFSFNATLSATSGHIRLFDSNDSVIDTVGWRSGTSIPASPEKEAALGPAGGASITRITQADGLYQDTDSNAVDFAQTVPLHHASGLYEQVVILDVCTNIDGLQESVPPRYTADGLICSVVALPVLYLTELLPNPVGDDTGSEFIELYNPNLEPVNLEHYRLRIGSALDKQYIFPVGAVVGAGEYYIVKNSDVGFTLANSSGRVQLTDDFGTIIAETPAYTDASDGWSWAIVGDRWLLTNQPTPGATNLLPNETDQENSSILGSTILVPCGAGKYRNPLTNRCRNIEADASVLADCDADEYRNPETNRCRKIASTASSLTLCDPDEVRNPETNRCRKTTAVTSELAACKDGQERNPETNRCRTIAASTIPTANFAVQPIPDSPQMFVGWWALAGIGVLALGYAAWEWRHEMRIFLTALRRAFRRGG